MSKKRSVFAVFSIIMGSLLFAIWGNIHVYAQQQPPPLQSRAADSLTPELKAKMCNPGNPSLKVVNATESRICGIPRTVKPHTSSSAATPPTSADVSSSTPPQTTTTKPTSVTSVSTAPHPHAKQQQITNTNASVTSQETKGVIGSKIAPAARLTNSLSSSPSSSPSHIAPQVKAINQQQHQTPTTTADSSSTGKKQSSSATTTKSDNTRTINIDDNNQILKSSHHIRSGNSDTQDSRSITTTKTSGLPSDLASYIKNKVDSIIRNNMKGLIYKTPFILPFH